MKFNDILTKERLEYVRSARNFARKSAFSEAEEKIGESATIALKELYNSFDERIYIFLAELWDPDMDTSSQSRAEVRRAGQNVPQALIPHELPASLLD